MNAAVDAMGGDKDPEVVVQGAVEVADAPGIHVTLVGDREAILDVLCSYSPADHITVHHCEGVVGMDESPLKAVRQKNDASIRVAFDLVKKGDADAVVSAGNSGATLAAGILTLGRMEGWIGLPLPGSCLARKGL